MKVWHKYDYKYCQEVTSVFNKATTRQLLRLSAPQWTGHRVHVSKLQSFIKESDIFIKELMADWGVLYTSSSSERRGGERKGKERRGKKRKGKERWGKAKEKQGQQGIEMKERSGEDKGGKKRRGEEEKERKGAEKREKDETEQERKGKEMNSW